MNAEQLKTLAINTTRAGLVFGLAGSGLTACDNNRSSGTVPVTKPPVSAPSRETAKFSLADPYSELKRFYPELKTAGLSPRTVDRIATESQTPTTVYNFTDYRFDPQIASSVYNFLEFVAKRSRLAFHLIGADGSERNVLLLPRNTIENRLMVVIPPDVPKPNVGSYNLSNVPAATFFPEDIAAFSYVQLGGSLTHFFDGEEANLDLAVATEVCNQAIFAAVIDKRNTFVDDPEELNRAQMLSCATIAIAQVAGSQGIPYEKYINFLRRTISIPNQGQYRLLPLPREPYRMIPQVGSMIKLKS